MQATMSVRALVALASLTALPLVALAGPMTPPPGVPGATMKTLAEVEPRIAINATNTPGDANSAFRITQPGSYYLTQDHTFPAGRTGILITSDNVTLDLSGFTLTQISTSDSDAPIWVDGPSGSLKGVVIRNGHVIGGGSAGVYAQNTVGARIEGITSRNCYSSAIEVGIGAIVTDCVAADSDIGIYAANGSLIERCTMVGNTRGATIYAATIRNSAVRATSTGDQVGIEAGGDCVVEHNQISGGWTGGPTVGIRVVGTGNRITGNHIAEFRWGIYGESGATGNFVVSNTSRGNVGSAITFSSSPNAIGPIVANPGAAFTTTSPYANFTW